MEGDVMSTGMIVLIILGIIAGAALIITIAVLTLPKLKAYLKSRKEKKARQKVAFGDTRKIINSNAEEILKNAPKMTMEDLERMCEDTPYFAVDMDIDTEELSDFTSIKTEEVGNDFDEFMDGNGGIVVFD